MDPAILKDGRRVHPYRTVILAHSALAWLVAGLALCTRWPSGVALFPAFVGGVVAVVGSVAAKAYGEHRANAQAAP